jgi:hypothetical protein
LWKETLPLGIRLERQLNIRGMAAGVRWDPLRTLWLAIKRFELVGVMEDHLLIDLFDEAFATELSEQAGNGFAGDAGHAAEFFVGEGHGEGDREIHVAGEILEFVGAGPVQESVGEFAGGIAGEGESPSAKEGRVVFAGESDGSATANFVEGLHEANEVGAGNGFEGAGAESDGGHAMGRALKQSSEADDLAGYGNTQKQHATFGGRCNEFDAATADEEYVIGDEALVEQNLMGAEGDRRADGVEGE